jgi:hypothetical protein
VDLAGSEYGEVEGYYESGNEFLVSFRGGEICEQLQEEGLCCLGLEL